MAKRNFACLVIVVFGWFADNAIAQPRVSDANGCEQPAGCGQEYREATNGLSATIIRENQGTERAGSVVPGDICLSAFLSQCYPERNPNTPDAQGGANWLAR